MTPRSPRPSESRRAERPDSESKSTLVGLRRVEIRRRDGPPIADLVAVEEPLEIRVDGRPLAITMRTPGDDEELVAGFLYSEGLIDSAAQIETMEVVTGAEEGDLIGLGEEAGEGLCKGGSRIAVRFHGGLDEAAFERAHREFRATAACGVCGKRKLEDLSQDFAEIQPLECELELLEKLPAVMRERQRLFHATGGIHAAGCFDSSGKLLLVREDIGRHNAVDKVIGHFVLGGQVPLHDRILVVSGRAGFELVQKALRAAVPVMVAVGAASSMAVEMATHSGMALYSFMAPGRGNLHI